MPPVVGVLQPPSSEGIYAFARVKIANSVSEHTHCNKLEQDGEFKRAGSTLANAVMGQTGNYRTKHSLLSSFALSANHS